MEKKAEIRYELIEISPFWADMGQSIPYSLPQGYFQSLPAIVLEKIQDKSALLPNPANSYTIPENYFTDLPGLILSKIQKQSLGVNEVATELAEVAPMLNTISKQQVYAVPQGYFERTDFVAASRITGREAKIVNLKSVRKWMQYAAVAVFAGVLITGAFMFTDNSGNYLEFEQYKQLDVPAELNKLNEDELVKYLDNNQEHTVLTASEAQSANEEDLFDVKNNIQNLSDEELTQYLKENGETASVNALKKE